MGQIFEGELEVDLIKAKLIISHDLFKTHDVCFVAFTCVAMCN